MNIHLVDAEKFIYTHDPELKHLNGSRVIEGAFKVVEDGRIEVIVEPHDDSWPLSVTVFDDEIISSDDFDLLNQR